MDPILYNLIVVLGFGIFSYEVINQSLKILRTKSADDIAFRSVILRLVATLFLLAAYSQLGKANISIILGQIVFTICMSFYTYTVWRIQKKYKKSTTHENPPL